VFKSKSEMITEGLRKSFHSTDCKMANRRCYGYDMTLGGKLVINEAESKIVHWIFDRYLIGDNLSKIAAGLERQGVLSSNGKSKWNCEAISKLLSNEKYTGSVLLQKTMSFVGAQLKNDGVLDQVLLKDHHKATISTADFEKVQQVKNECSNSPVQEMKMVLSFT